MNRLLEHIKTYDDRQITLMLLSRTKDYLKQAIKDNQQRHTDWHNQNQAYETNDFKEKIEIDQYLLHRMRTIEKIAYGS